MEVIRKPKQPAIEIISVRVTAGLKKDQAKAREIAERLDIDMTAMVTQALGDVFNSIIHAGTKAGAPAPDDRKRIQNVNSLQNVNMVEGAEPHANGGLSK